MQLAVFGGTGEQLILAALRAGHTVTAPVRDPSRIRISDSTLRVVRADVNQHLRRGRTISRADLAAAMLSLLDDPEAVRSTVGVAY